MTDHDTQVRAIRAEYEADLARARNPGLHPVAQRIGAAQAYTRAAGQLRELEEQDTAARTLAAAADAPIWRSGDALAGRDARDRAQRITTPASAATAINEASRAGDEDLVREVAYQAVRRGAAEPEGEWGRLATDYLQQTGQWGAMTKLATGQGKGADVLAARGKYWLSAPEELRGMADYEIGAMASRDPGEAVQRATARQRAAWDGALRRSGQR